MTEMHRDAQHLMAMMRAAGRPPFEEMTPVEARQAYAAGRPVLQPDPPEVASVQNLSIPGPGGDLPLRIYRGLGTGAADLPCLLYLHGGGWVIGDLESHDGLCRRLANDASCCVVAVDYRLAPEHPFPAAIDDATAALRAVMNNAAEWRIDPARIAVGGDSAGGNLAAILALMGRDGAVPAPLFQLLIYPVTDLANATPPLARVVDGVPLTTAAMKWFIDLYTPDHAARTDWRASPLRAPSLAGAAPALVLTVAHDPLCDEGRAYAARLEAEGVPTTHLHVADQPHGMMTMGRIIGPVDLYMQMLASYVRAAFG